MSDWNKDVLLAENQMLIEKQNAIIEELREEIKSYNEYFESFACENFDEFQDFISTFMLTPHEEQTLIRELENKTKSLESNQNQKAIECLKDVREKIKNLDNKIKYVSEMDYQIMAENGIIDSETFYQIVDNSNEAKENFLSSVKSIFDNKIKELEKEKCE